MKRNLKSSLLSLVMLLLASTMTVVIVGCGSFTQITAKGEQPGTVSVKVSNSDDDTSSTTITVSPNLDLSLTKDGKENETKEEREKSTP